MMGQDSGFRGVPELAHPPVAPVPGPRVAEVVEVVVAAEEHDLRPGRVIRGDREASTPRRPRWMQLGPVSPVPGPRVALLSRVPFPVVSAEPRVRYRAGTASARLNLSGVGNYVWQPDNEVAVDEARRIAGLRILDLVDLMDRRPEQDVSLLIDDDELWLEPAADVQVKIQDHLDPGGFRWGMGRVRDSLAPSARKDQDGGTRRDQREPGGRARSEHISHNKTSTRPCRCLSGGRSSPCAQRPFKGQHDRACQRAAVLPGHAFPSRSEARPCTTTARFSRPGP
jgi:hypothetical protein